jgi:hypothetical protein
MQCIVSEVLTFCLHTLAPMSFTTDGNGTQEWFDADGKLHRDGDLPAKVAPHGNYWFRHGKLHRDGDLPAVVWHGRHTCWFKDGLQHRDGDLPAVTWADGTQIWYRHGRRHRSHDLPAVVWADGRQEWWVDNERQTPEDRAQTRRWSVLRAAFVGAAVVHTS